MPQLLKGEYTEQVARGLDAWSLRQPLGVVAGITPFNFPAMVPLWMFPLAIGCGNAFILKPSERDLGFAAAGAMAARRRAAGRRLQRRAGRQGPRRCHPGSPGIAAVSFVGSTPVAEHIYQSGHCARQARQALGGAKNHLIVMPDADLDGAVDALLGAAYGSAGERCMAISVAVAVGEVGTR